MSIVFKLVVAGNVECTCVHAVRLNCNIRSRNAVVSDCVMLMIAVGLQPSRRKETIMMILTSLVPDDFHPTICTDIILIN